MEYPHCDSKLSGPDLKYFARYFLCVCFWCTCMFVLSEPLIFRALTLWVLKLLTKFTPRGITADKFDQCYRLRTVSVLTAAFSGVRDLSPPFLLDLERGELLINFL